MAKLACYACQQPAAELAPATLTGYGQAPDGTPRLLCPWCAHALALDGLEQLEQARREGVPA